MYVAVFGLLTTPYFVVRGFLLDIRYIDGQATGLTPLTTITCSQYCIVPACKRLCFSYPTTNKQRCCTCNDRPRTYVVDELKAATHPEAFVLMLSVFACG